MTIATIAPPSADSADRAPGLALKARTVDAIAKPAAISTTMPIENAASTPSTTSPADGPARSAGLTAAGAKSDALKLIAAKTR